MSSSHPQTAASSSSNFQQIINNALKAYEKRTKNDLLAHPLAAQLQACHSPDAILAVLQKQVEDLNQSRNTNERWTKWLNPTVNVLFSLSARVSVWYASGYGLTQDMHPHMYLAGLLTCKSGFCWCWCSPFGTYFSLFLCIRRCNAPIL